MESGQSAEGPGSRRKGRGIQAGSEERRQHVAYQETAAVRCGDGRQGKLLDSAEFLSASEIGRRAASYAPAGRDIGCELRGNHAKTLANGILSDGRQYPRTFIGGWAGGWGRVGARRGARPSPAVCR